MAEWVRKYGGVLLTALIAACSAAVFVAQSVAKAEVSPVREKIVQLEERTSAQKERLDRMANQIDDIWRWLREERKK